MWRKDLFCTVIGGNSKHQASGERKDESKCFPNHPAPWDKVIFGVTHLT